MVNRRKQTFKSQDFQSEKKRIIRFFVKTMVRNIFRRSFMVQKVRNILLVVLRIFSIW
jgi:hypothetical protein